MSDPLGVGPFFHGTRADLRADEFLTAGFRSNCRSEVLMDHIYITALPDGAGRAAELAAGDGAPTVYVVWANRTFGGDPNVTDQAVALMVGDKKPAALEAMARSSCLTHRHVHRPPPGRRYKDSAGPELR